MYFFTSRNMVSTTVLHFSTISETLPCTESCSISHPDLVIPRHCARKISYFNLLLSNYSKYFFQEGQGEKEGTENFAQNILQRKKHFPADRDNLCSCIPSCSPTCQRMGIDREMAAKIVCRTKKEERKKQLEASKKGKAREEQKEHCNGQHQDSQRPCVLGQRNFWS